MVKRVAEVCAADVFYNTWHLYDDRDPIPSRYSIFWAKG